MPSHPCRCDATEGVYSNWMSTCMWVAFGVCVCVDCHWHKGAAVVVFSPNDSVQGAGHCLWRQPLVMWCVC